MVILPVLILLIVLSTQRLPILLWAFLWPLTVWVLIRYGIEPLVPVSVLKIYLWLTVAGVLTYVYADPERYRAFFGALQAFICKPQYRLALHAVVVVLPCLYAAKIYSDINVEVKAPTFGRTIHPAPPSEISFKGKSIDLVKGKNPFRELQTANPEEFNKRVANGKVVYYDNCVYCHGDDMGGDGIFAHALTPTPANFNSATTIAMLQEGYLFWRIAKGGPGLPEESGPWSSSMPAWENFLTEEQIWEVILYLYEYTGFTPRAEEVHH